MVLHLLVRTHAGVMTDEGTARQGGIGHGRSTVDEGPMPDEHIPFLGEKNARLEAILFNQTLDMLLVAFKERIWCVSASKNRALTPVKES